MWCTQCFFCLTVKDRASHRVFLFEDSGFNHIFMLSSKLCWDNSLHLVNKKIPLHLHLIFTFFVTPCGWNPPHCVHSVHVLWFLLPHLPPLSTKKGGTGGCPLISHYQELAVTAGKLTSQKSLKQLQLFNNVKQFSCSCKRIKEWKKKKKGCRQWKTKDWN